MIKYGQVNAGRNMAITTSEPISFTVHGRSFVKLLGVCQYLYFLQSFILNLNFLCMFLVEYNGIEGVDHYFHLSCSLKRCVNPMV